MYELSMRSSLCSAGLLLRSKINSGKFTSSGALHGIHKMIQSEEFSSILRMDNVQRIDKFEYPLKMRNIQEAAVKDLSKSDELRKKVRFILCIYNCDPA